jgi:Tol biopolymer transport system component
MKKISFIMFILFAAIAFISCNKAKQAPELPLEDFFRNPEKTGFSLSPDGKHLVFMAPYKEMMNAYYSVAGEDSAIRLTEETDRSIYFAAWANNNTVIYFKDKGGDVNLQIFSVDINSRETKPVFAKDGVRANPLDVLEDQPDYILITTNERNPNAFDPYRFNLVTGEMEMLAENPGNIVSWITDHDGKLRMAVASDGVNTSILYRQDENQDFKELMNISFKDEFSPYFFSFDNKKIYAASNIGRDKTAFVLYKPEKN